jgi:hypothetical protein
MARLGNLFESVFSNFSNLFTSRNGSDTGVVGVERGTSIRDYTGMDTQIASALAALYTKSVSTRRDFLLEFDRVKPFYIVQALINALIEDSLTPDATTGEVLQITSQNKEIHAELQVLQKMFNFDQIINDIVFDLIAYGEYTLRLDVEKGKGVTAINDDIDQSRVVAFYEQGYPYRYIKQTDRDLEVYPAYKFVHFVYGRNKLRVKVENEFTEVGNFRDTTGFPYPTYARVGKPLLFGVMGKIKELMVLEQLIPASKLNQLLTGSLVGLQVPTSMSPDEGFKAARRYEQILNRHKGVDRTTGELTIVDIISVAGKVRVLPQFGDKGQLTNFNEVKENRTVDDLLGAIRDIREVICTSIGFPAELLFGGETGVSKNEFLKRYSRYLRKLKAVQYCLSLGIVQIVLAHMINRGYENINAEDVQVVFRNELINIESLEKLEFADAVVSIIGNIDRFVREMKDGVFNSFIDDDAYQAYLYQAFSILGRDTNFIKPPANYREKGQELEVM